MVNHLAFKERNPQDTAEDIRKKKRYLALNISHRFTTEEWYEAIGEDNIPSPPYYTMGSFILDKGFPKEINQRLEGWAKYDPQGNDLQNPLRSNKALEYWKRYDPDCLMSGNPYRQRSGLTPPLPPFFRLRLLPRSSQSHLSHPPSQSHSPSQSFRSSLPTSSSLSPPPSSLNERSSMRPKRVRKPTEKSRQLAEDEKLIAEARNRRGRSTSVAKSVEVPAKRRKI